MTELPPPLLTLTAHGTPAPQGSKRYVGQSGAGRAIMVESSKKVAPWRAIIYYAAWALVGCKCPDPMCTSLTEGWPLDEPVVVAMTFTLPKPASAPKRKPSWPDRYPDVIKLARSTEDALSKLLWYDDARIITYTRLAKVYPNEGEDALPVPGVLLRLWRHADLLRQPAVAYLDQQRPVASLF